MKALILITILFITPRSRAQGIGSGLNNISINSSINKELERNAGTFLFSGINITINTLNVANFNNAKKKSNAGFGIIIGLAQVVNDALYHEKEEDLKTIDLSVGATTVIFSSICLLKNKKSPKQGKLSLTPVFSRIPFFGRVSCLALRFKF